MSSAESHIYESKFGGTLVKCNSCGKLNPPYVRCSCLPDIAIQSTSDNNGGSTDYYKFAPSWRECADIIEARNMNYNQGNIFKAAFCFNTGRHKGTTYERELNKIIYFAERELKNLKDINGVNLHTR